MNNQDNVQTIGVLELVLKDEFGNVKQIQKAKNLVVTTGRNYIASRMVGTIANTMSHMAIGTGNVAPAAGNTTLGTEVGRVVFGASPTATNNVVAYTATFGPGVGTGAITEAGIFNANSAGTLLCRTTFSVINKGALDSLTINWNTTVA
jgi:hypothetical protein